MLCERARPCREGEGRDRERAIRGARPGARTEPTDFLIAVFFFSFLFFIRLLLFIPVKLSCTPATGFSRHVLNLLCNYIHIFLLHYYALVFNECRSIISVIISSWCIIKLSNATSYEHLTSLRARMQVINGNRVYKLFNRKDADAEPKFGSVRPKGGRKKKKKYQRRDDFFFF